MSRPYIILVRKPERKRSLGRPRRIWESNIKIVLEKSEFGSVDRTHLFQVRLQWILLDSGWIL
jgi:hypothetical protein